MMANGQQSFRDGWRLSMPFKAAKFANNGTDGVRWVMMLNDGSRFWTNVHRV